jgi:hypothetical protein
VTPGTVSHTLVIDPDVTDLDQAGAELIAAALQAQMRDDFAPEWGAGEGDTFRADGATALPGEVECQFHNDAPADEQGALAIHNRKPDGTPILHVFVKLAFSNGVSLSSCLSHEALEARVDPDLTECVQLPDGRIAAKEICDQVEAISYNKGVNGQPVAVSNFNTRANFAPTGQPGEKYDFCGSQTSPFQVLPGGYAQVLDGANGWVQISGGMSAYRAELHRLGLSRSARRARK